MQSPTYCLNLSVMEVNMHLWLREYCKTRRHMHAHMYTHNGYTMHSRHPKIVWWKNLYWCPVISALLRRGLVIQPGYNRHLTLWPHVIHSPNCSTITQALSIWIRARGNGVEARLDGALLLIPANPNHLWTEVTQTTEMLRQREGICTENITCTYISQNVQYKSVWLLTI